MRACRIDGQSLAAALVAVLFAAGCGSSGAGKEAAGDGSAANGDVTSPVEAASDDSTTPTNGPDSSVDAGSAGQDAPSTPMDASGSGLGDGAAPSDAGLIGDGGGSRRFVVENKCTQTVWAAALPSSTFPGGIVEMVPGSSFEVAVADGWSGRIWGKTQCTMNGTKLTCASDPFPSSLAEFTLTKTPATGLDFYDVSLVDGFNLPIEIVALGHTPDPAHPYSCGDPLCAQDLNATCPQPLQDQVAGKTIACANDECKVLGNNVASSPYCMYPNQYTRFFKTACPTAYSYPYDDPTSTFTCKGENSYAIIFCP